MRRRPTGNVESLPGDSVYQSRLKIGAHHVIHTDEIAGLLPIPIDDRSAACDRCLTKRGMTAAYPESGFWRGPKTLK